jgi:hypothetical protein
MLLSVLLMSRLSIHEENIQGQRSLRRKCRSQRSSNSGSSKIRSGIKKERSSQERKGGTHGCDYRGELGYSDAATFPPGQPQMLKLDPMLQLQEPLAAKWLLGNSIDNLPWRTFSMGRQQLEQSQ